MDVVDDDSNTKTDFADSFLGRTVRTLAHKTDLGGLADSNSKFRFGIQISKLILHPARWLTLAYNLAILDLDLPRFWVLNNCGMLGSWPQENWPYDVQQIQASCAPCLVNC